MLPATQGFPPHPMSPAPIGGPCPEEISGSGTPSGQKFGIRPHTLGAIH